MSKSKGRRLAEWLRNLDSNSKAGSNTLADDSVGSDQLAHDLALQGNPTAATQSSGNSSTRLATTAFVATEVAALVDSAPGALNTLNELAAAVNDDASFSTTITNSIALKAPLASPALTGTPTAPTASSGTNTTQLATTAFVTAAVAAGGGGVDGISSSADATAITIDSSERVGIGATSPVGILHIKSDDNGVVFQSSSSSNSRAQIFFQNNGGTTTGKIAVDPDGGNANVMAFSTGSSERMRIDSSGNVGIGVTSPTAKLEVGASSGDAIVLRDTNLTSSSSDIGNVRIAWDDSAGTRVAYVGSVNSDEFWVNNQNSKVVLTYAGSRMFETMSGGAKLYGKLNITDSAYDNHLELNRSSEQWRFSPSTDGSLDIRRIGGTGTARVDVQSDLALLENSTQYYGGFGAATTGGTTNWNDTTNARAGNGYTLLLGTHSNGPGPSAYFHPFSFEYINNDGTGNMTQLAIPYRGGHDGANESMWMRSRYSGTWTGWVKLTPTPPAYGNYGTVRVDDDRGVNWAGYAIRDDWVFMSNSAASCGIYNDTDNEWAIKCHRNAQTSIYHDGAQKGYTYASGWRVTGNLLATSDVYAYYSDLRLKDKTGKIENALDKVGAIETFYYTHNNKAIELGYEDKKQQVGVSAQSVEAVMPEVVHLAPIDDDGEGNSVSGEEYKTVNYARLVPLLIESIKELRAEVEELKRG